MFEGDDIRQYDVVRNEAGQYSIWPVGRPVSPGWGKVGVQAGAPRLRGTRMDRPASGRRTWARRSMTRRPSLWQHDDFVRLWSPGLGGVLVQLLTAPVSILVDAVSFVSSAVLLVLIKHREDRPEQPGSDRPSLRLDVVADLRYVLGDAYLRPVVFATAVASLFGIFSMVQALLALFAVRSLGVSPTGLGAVLAVANGGALLGTLANGWLTRRLGFGPAITISMAGHGGVAAAAPGHSYHCAAHAGHWHGTGLVLCLVYNINQIGLRQGVTPERMLGRMNATVRFVIWESSRLAHCLVAGSVV